MLTSGFDGENSPSPELPKEAHDAVGRSRNVSSPSQDETPGEPFVKELMDMGRGIVVPEYADKGGVLISAVTGRRRI